MPLTRNTSQRFPRGRTAPRTPGGPRSRAARPRRERPHPRRCHQYTRRGSLPGRRRARRSPLRRRRSRRTVSSIRLCSPSTRRSRKRSSGCGAAPSTGRSRARGRKGKFPRLMAGARRRGRQPARARGWRLGCGGAQSSLGTSKPPRTRSSSFARPFQQQQRRLPQPAPGADEEARQVALGLRAPRSLLTCSHRHSSKPCRTPPRCLGPLPQLPSPLRCRHTRRRRSGCRRRRLSCGSPRFRV